MLLVTELSGATVISGNGGGGGTGNGGAGGLIANLSIGVSGFDQIRLLDHNGHLTYSAAAS